MHVKVPWFFFVAIFLVRCKCTKKISNGNEIIKQQLIITDQSENRIVIADVETGKITWEWLADQSNIHPQDIKWFNAPSDAKAVYDNEYILLNASGGGVALVRIADKKLMFYAYAGGNTHSAELLPDGNIVTASSTGSYLMVFHTDTLHFPENIYSKKIPLPFAHNVVWDKKRNILWSAAKNKLYSFKYNFNCGHPDLKVVDSTLLPDTDAHDLFPMFDKDSLWLTTVHGVFKIDPSTKKVILLQEILQQILKMFHPGRKAFLLLLCCLKKSGGRMKYWIIRVTASLKKKV